MLQSGKKLKEGRGSRTKVRSEQRGVSRQKSKDKPKENKLSEQKCCSKEGDNWGVGRKGQPTLAPAKKGRHSSNLPPQRKRGRSNR